MYHPRDALSWDLKGKKSYVHIHKSAIIECVHTHMDLSVSPWAWAHRQRAPNCARLRKKTVYGTVKPPLSSSPKQGVGKLVLMECKWGNWYKRDIFHPQERATSLTHPSAAVQIRFTRAVLRGSAGNKGLEPIKKSRSHHIAECCQRGWRMSSMMETEGVIAFWQGGHCKLK